MDSKTKEKLLRLIKQATDLVENDPDAERLYDLQKLSESLLKARKHCEYIVPTDSNPTPTRSENRKRRKTKV